MSSLSLKEILTVYRNLHLYVFLLITSLFSGLIFYFLNKKKAITCIIASLYNIYFSCVFLRFSPYIWFLPGYGCCFKVLFFLYFFCLNFSEVRGSWTIWYLAVNLSSQPGAILSFMEHLIISGNIFVLFLGQGGDKWGGGYWHLVTTGQECY